MNKTIGRVLTLALLLGGPVALAPHAVAAPQSYPVTTTLDGRTVKDPNVPVGAQRVSDQYPVGTSVAVVCQDDGPSYGGSTIWDLTTDGYWVPNGYVDTGSTGYVAARCAIPKSYPAEADLNGRTNKGDAADAPGVVVNKYRSGASVPVDCQASADGAIWDHTTDKVWVPDQYVKTGVSGFVQGLPRCDTGSGDSGGGSAVHGRSNGPAGPTTGTRAEKIARVIAAAKSQVGLGYDYAWGAGGKGGASYGIHHYPDGNPAEGDDYSRHGYDCSGLTLYAFWKGAGIDIGDWTGDQYNAGTRIAISQMQAGDLIFWGSGDDSDSTTHVVIYLGNNQIIEAAPPRDGNSVHVRTLYGQSDWMAHVIRVI